MALHETDPQLVARLMAQGGKILVVGGETKDLPDKITKHPSILIWDDNKQDFANKTIPSNIKIFIWNRWVSHTTVGILNQAAKDLHALKFPFLRSREIKELLSELTSRPLVENAKPVVEEEIVASNLIQEKEIEVADTKEEIVKKSTGKGWLRDYVAKHININLDYSGRNGNLKREGERIFEKTKKDGIKTTEASVVQVVGLIVRGLKNQSSPAPKITAIKSAVAFKAATSKTTDEFGELDTLISDAITALKLVQEHMPKLRKEVAQLRAAKDKIRALLETNTR